MLRNIRRPLPKPIKNLSLDLSMLGRPYRLVSQSESKSHVPELKDIHLHGYFLRDLVNAYN